MASELDELANELVHGLEPWEPVDEALMRWLFLPWYKRLWHWVVTL